jgi:hypothetical protein
MQVDHGWVGDGVGAANRVAYTEKRGRVMSDGREERAEREMRFEQEKREDRIDRGEGEEREPERVDS